MVERELRAGIEDYTIGIELSTRDSSPDQMRPKALPFLPQATTVVDFSFPRLSSRRCFLVMSCFSFSDLRRAEEPVTPVRLDCTLGLFQGD